MKKLFFLVGCLLVLGSAPVQAAEDPALVVVRIVESRGSVNLYIARGAAEAEHIEFDTGFRDKAAGQTAVSYQRELAKLYAQGYVLQSTLSNHGRTDPEFSQTVSTLIFVKAPKP
ncbi:hypothetical protein [Hymenobacter defluvii]|uniref:DUF4177 domain-containing protein n=1 Tax=Hymenobacter defluvii TaxID=2054411 RepID=A0ABS3THS5_9BACT|nr:hypothetical protein [Hymenobacter defluvii]MBO3273211.1 hypothetical protein [Hymenobacter defluvii]